MLQITPQIRIYMATAPIDFRKGIDGLAQACRERIGEDPFSGAMFVFTNRGRTSIKVLTYDGFGFWLCQKRLSRGRFKFLPRREDGLSKLLTAYELQILLWNGNPRGCQIGPEWRPIYE